MPLLPVYLALATTALAGDPVVCVPPFVVSGETSTYPISGLEPGESATLVRGTAEGAGPCPDVLEGLCLDLDNAAIMGHAIADDGGVAPIDFALPDNAPAGRLMFLQAVVERGPDSAKSEVVVARVAGDFDLPGNCANDDLCVTGLDADADGVEDQCDPCPIDDPDDTDGDTVCDSDDVCPGADDLADSDGDAVCDALDVCHGDDLSGDTDGDGVCDTISLFNADAKLVGLGDTDYAGHAVSIAGDVNGDGFDDVLVGAAWVDVDVNNEGTTYLLHGPIAGTLQLSAADAELVGEAEFDLAGYAVSRAGDLNGDGFDDVFVGAYGEDAGGAQAGAAYLVHGPMLGTVALSGADAKLVGEDDDDFVGWAVSPAGDVNGDGTPDLFVGAYGESAGGSEAGAAYLVHGPVSGEVDLATADAKLVGEAAGDFAGWSASGAGDVNGDGFHDLLVGAIYNDVDGAEPGAAYLALGPVSGEVDLSAADAKLVGEAGGDFLGMSVSDAGDLNDDGIDDFLVGAHRNDEGDTDAGAVYVVLGPPPLGEVDIATADAKLFGEKAFNYTGDATAAAGDVNGDGFGDIVVGPGGTDLTESTVGGVYLVLGPVSGSIDLSGQVDARYVGEATIDSAGTALSGDGDVDGDGFDDFIAGAYRNDAGATDGGAAYLLYGSPM